MDRGLPRVVTRHPFTVAWALTTVLALAAIKLLGVLL